MSIRSIPSPTGVNDVETRKVLEASREVLMLITGQLPNSIIRDQALLVSDLQDAGVIGVQGKRIFNNQQAAAAAAQAALDESTNLYIEKYITAGSQAFTAAAGFEKVTGLTTSVSAGTWVSDASSVTIGTAGNYLVLVTMSMSSSVVLVVTEGHLFVDDAEVARIGWSRKIATSGDQGSASGNGLITLAANQVIDLRIDVDKNTTLTIDHLSIILRRL